MEISQPRKGFDQFFAINRYKPIGVGLGTREIVIGRRSVLGALRRLFFCL